MSLSSAEIAARAGDHWSSVRYAPGRGRWWLHPPIIQHINRIICGKNLPGIVDADAEVIRSLNPNLEIGVSIGCGDAGKEIILLRRNVVNRFIVYEVSEVRAQRAIQKAASLGISERLEVRQELFDFDRTEDRYDLVYWNNSLHHMPDTRAALRWSRRSLRPGGVFYMNDFVGPTYMQHSPAAVQWACRVREALPERLLAKPDGGLLPRRVAAPDPIKLAAIDPSECVDSGNILPGLAETFPSSEVRLTGGVIYHHALNDVLSNVTDDDSALIESLLLLDESLTGQGLTHYGAAWFTA